MCPHVILESTGLCARVFTLCTTERLFSWMGPYVCLEIRSSFARVVAMCAAEWFSLWMGEHVCLKVTSLCTWVVALWAIVRFFPCMFSIVCLQSISTGAREFAQCATKGFFSWMGPHVSLEIRSLFARVVALFANEKLFAIILRLTDIAWCVDCLHFCDRPSTKVEGQLIGKVVRIFGEGQWKVKVITLSDSDASRFEMFQKFYNTTFFNQKFYTLKRVYQDYFYAQWINVNASILIIWSFSVLQFIWMCKISTV